MSYDLAVWEGPHPGSHEQAAVACDQALAGLDAAPGRDLSEPVAAFLSHLTGLWPDSDPDRDGFPWAQHPLRERCASGTVAYLSIATGTDGGQVEADVVRLAKEHGLNVFDPQLEELL